MDKKQNQSINKAEMMRRFHTVMSGEEPQQLAEELQKVLVGKARVSGLIALLSLMEAGLENMDGENSKRGGRAAAAVRKSLGKLISDCILKASGVNPKVSTGAAEAVAKVFDISTADAKEYLTANTGSYHLTGVDNHVWVSGSVVAEILQVAGVK